MKKVAICFITDEGYALPTEVALHSISNNKKPSTFYSVYILCNNVSKKTKAKLNSVGNNNLSIVCIDVNHITNISNFKIEGIPATPSSIYKFFIPEIVSNEDKIIYLDGDVIVQRDLLELYELDLGSNYIAAVKDLSGLTYLNTMNPNYNYFNSGVMVMNLKILRENNISNKLLDYRKNGYNTLMDQDALNYVLKGRVKMLPFIYNTQTSALMLSIRKTGNCSVEKIWRYWSIPSDIKGFNEVLSNATIVHFTSTKPWKYFDNIGLEIWLKYYYMSSYRKAKLTLEPQYITQIVASDTYKIGNAILKPAKSLKHSLKRLLLDKRRGFLSEFIYDNGEKNDHRV